MEYRVTTKDNGMVKGVEISMSVAESLLFHRAIDLYALTGECEADREEAKRMSNEILVAIAKAAEKEPPKELMRK